jgi:hypothetical protein
VPCSEQQIVQQTVFPWKKGAIQASLQQTCWAVLGKQKSRKHMCEVTELALPHYYIAWHVSLRNVALGASLTYNTMLSLTEPKTHIQPLNGLTTLITILRITYI